MTADVPTELIIQSWCLRELALWQAKELPYDKVMADLNEANRRHPTVFLLSIVDGVVTLADKEEFYTREELDDPDSVAPSIGRIHAYKNFIACVLAQDNAKITTTLAICVNDTPIERFDIPVCGFQKVWGSPAILLPDIDFLGHNFYVVGDYDDMLSYHQKRTSAIFVGGTSGGGLITAKTAQDLSVPRIRSALYFKGHNDVYFTLPNIGQCDSEETKELIRSMGISGNRASFPDQLRHKFMISMDGNGATCSRVAIALRSNSALLKYDSPHMLYYFQQLTPWVHYIPIYRDSDITHIVNLEKRDPGKFEYVARMGSKFFKTFLSRSRIFQYTSELLAMYADIFSPASTRCAGEIPLHNRDHAGITDGYIDFDILLHVQNRGDVWSRAESWNGGRGSGLAIEGVAIYARDPYLFDNLEYRVLGGTTGISDWYRSGDFAGTRGMADGLRGLSIRIGGAQTERYECSYCGVCTDGTPVGPAQSGEMCCGETGAPLESFQILVRIRNHDEAPAEGS